MIASVLCAMPLVTNGCMATDEWIDTPIVVRQLELTPLLARWSLRVEQVESVFPMESGQQAMLIDATDFRTSPIKNLGDLEGCVRIQDESQALEFVRLFTAQDTWYWSDDHIVEITNSGSPSAVDDYGFGRVSAGMWAELELKSPAVRKNGETFLITRFVVDGDGRVLCIEESVSQRGGYSRRLIRMVTENAQVTPPILY